MDIIRKCRFALPEVKFCGMTVESGKRRIDPEKVAAVEAIKVPQTKKQARQIM